MSTNMYIIELILEGWGPSSISWDVFYYVMYFYGKLRVFHVFLHVTLAMVLHAN